MTDGAPQTILKRKAAGRGAEAGGAMTPARALSHALAKTAEDMMTLPLRVTETQEVRMSLAELPERLTDRSLLAVLEGPGEALGLMALAPGTLATLIEMQTTGRIAGAAPQSRRPTRTDAAMSAQFIDALLGTFEMLLGSNKAIVWAGGFRYASYLDDPRPLALLLEDLPYRTFRLTVEFGANAERQSDILIALPADGRGRAPATGDGKPDDPGRTADREDWCDRMESAVMGARCEIEAVLDRVTLPLSALTALQPGSQILLSKGALARVRIEGKGRRLIGLAKLGQCQGSLALRLHLPEPEDRSENPDRPERPPEAAPPANPAPSALPPVAETG